MNRFFKTYRAEICLVMILIVALVLRLVNLSYQSLWLDELHLMNEADPSITWNALIKYLHYSDLQPPLYFVIERTAFRLFGYNEVVARMVTAIAGTISVWVMYLLGKEMLHKRLGLLCALITCFNYYNIYYSQEARPYIFSFLFAALSFVYFLRLLKLPSLKNGLLYSFWTLVFLYTHYFSLFAVTAQGLLALIFIFQQKGAERKALLKSFFINGSIIIAGYAFWIPVILSIKQNEQTWIPMPHPDFIITYPTEYFGNEGLLTPFWVLLLIVFFVNVRRLGKKEGYTDLRSKPLLLCFVVATMWILVSYIVPYVRSLMSVPILYPRYTITVLPAIILMMAFGIETFKKTIIRNAMLSGFVLVSLISLVLVKRYYTKVYKAQFRQMTQFVVAQNKLNAPIINELTSWQQGYYLRKFNSKALILTGKKEALIDSIVHKSSAQYNLASFWIVGANTDKKPDSSALHSLDKDYKLVIQKDYFDAWALFYEAKKQQ